MVQSLQSKLRVFIPSTPIMSSMALVHFEIANSQSKYQAYESYQFNKLLRSQNKNTKQQEA